VEIKRLLEAGKPRDVITKMVDKLQEFLSSGGGDAGYPSEAFLVHPY